MTKSKTIIYGYPKMGIERVTHVGVCVSDLERAIRFYRDILGFRYLSRIHLLGEPSDTLLSLKGVDLGAGASS